MSNLNILLFFLYITTFGLYRPLEFFLWEFFFNILYQEKPKRGAVFLTKERKKKEIHFFKELGKRELRLFTKNIAF